jgi:hypothetical protein
MLIICGNVVLVMIAILKIITLDQWLQEHTQLATVSVMTSLNKKLIWWTNCKNVKGTCEAHVANYQHITWSVSNVLQYSQSTDQHAYFECASYEAKSMYMKPTNTYNRKDWKFLVLLYFATELGSGKVSQGMMKCMWFSAMFMLRDTLQKSTFRSYYSTNCLPLTPFFLENLPLKMLELIAKIHLPFKEA